MELISHSLDRGLAPPLVAGYDFVFQLKTGERPFVSPEVNPLLASSPVPLVRDKSSYLLAREAVAAGHLPPADEVRIEDFLAALDNLFPATNQPFALHLLGGPAPFGESGLQLLQVGVRVGGPTVVDPATGVRRLMAQGATLTVTFNPKVVQAYRLVGHATSTLTGPVPSVTRVDLAAGSELSGLFELWLKADGGNDVATVELAWHEPNSSAERHLAGRIARPQFAKSFGGAPASLQAVALAAEIARVLRSHTAPGRGLDRVLDLAAEVKPQLRQEPSFGELLQLAAQAEKVRANPGAGAVGPLSTANLRPALADFFPPATDSGTARAAAIEAAGSHLRLGRVGRPNAPLAGVNVATASVATRRLGRIATPRGTLVIIQRIGERLPGGPACDPSRRSRRRRSTAGNEIALLGRQRLF